MVLRGCPDQGPRAIITAITLVVTLVNCSIVAENETTVDNTTTSADNGRSVDNTTASAENGTTFGNTTTSADNGRSVDNTTASAENGTTFGNTTTSADNGRSIDNTTTSADYGRSVDNTTASTDNGTVIGNTTASADNGTTFDNTTASTDNGTIIDNTTASTDNGTTFDNTTASTDNGTTFDNTTASTDNGTTFDNTTASTDNGTVIVNATVFPLIPDINTSTTTTTAPGDWDRSDHGLPFNATLVVISSSPSTDVRYNTSTDVYTGNVRALRLTVNFTDQPDPTEMKVELWIEVDSDNRRTFAMNKNLDSHTGRLLKSHFLYYYEGEGVPFYSYYNIFLDRVDGHLNGVGPDEGDLSFTIDYDIVCIAQSISTDGEDTIKTAAMIRVGDFSSILKVPFVFKGEPKPAKAGEFDFTWLTKHREVEVLQPLDSQVMVTLGCPVSDFEIKVDFYRELNGTRHTNGLIVQTVRIISVGDAYGYLRYKMQVFGNESCPLDPTVTLTAGPWVKKDFLQGDATKANEDRASINISVVAVVTDPALVDTEVTLKVLARESQTPTCTLNRDKKSMRLSQTVLPQLHSKATQEGLELVIPEEEDISTGVTHLVELRLLTSGTGHTAYAITIDTKPETSSFWGSLKILQVSADAYGSNILCPSWSLVDKNPTPKTNQRDQSYTLSVYAINIGIEADPAANVLTLNVFVLLTGRANAEQRYYMEARLNKDSVQKAFIVDTPPEVSFWLELRNAHELRGYPGFVLITIATPPGGSMQYSLILRTDGPPNTLFDMAILTVNVVRSGANIQTYTQKSNLAVNLETSPDSGVTGTARVAFWLTNRVSVDEPGANQLQLEVVVMTTAHEPISMPPATDYFLEVSLNDLESQDIAIPIYPMEEIYYPLDNVHMKLSTSCRSQAFFPGMLADFTLEITTVRDTTVGPFVIVMKPNPGYTFEKANVDFRGPNVVCVKSGSIEPSEDHGVAGFEGGTHLAIPMLCNRERSSQKADDVLKVKMLVKLNGAIAPLTRDEVTKLFRVDVISNNQLVREGVQVFYVATLRDLGTLQVVRSALVSAVGLPTVTYSYYYYRVIGSGDAETVYCTNARTQLSSTEQDGYRTFSLYPNPIVAKYIGVTNYHYHNTGCSIDIQDVNTTSRDVPIVRGPRTQTESLSSNIGHLLQQRSGYRCAFSQERHTLERTPYIWADFRVSLFNLIQQPAPFIVELYGHNIRCDSRTGPQITMVAYKLSETGDQHRLCDLQPDKYPILKHNTYYAARGINQRCTFLCNCTGQAECSTFTLLAMQTSNEGNFSLWSLHASQYNNPPTTH